MKVHVDIKFESLNRNMSVPRTKVTDAKEKTVVELENKITHCTNILELETLFQRVDFSIETEIEVLEDIDGYYVL